MAHGTELDDEHRRLVDLERHLVRDALAMTTTEDSRNLISACFAGDAAAVRALLAADAQLARTRFEALGSTGLHISAHRGFAEIVDLLLAHGADPAAREGCSGTTPLHWAAEAGHLRVAEALMAHGATLDVRDTWHDQTPLDWAIWVVQSPQLHADRAATATYLASRGAAPSIFSCIAISRADAVRRSVERERSTLESRLGPVDGEATPLLFALERRLPQMAALLLDLGASPDAAGARGLSARATAELSDDAEARTLLSQRGAPADFSFLVASGDFASARAALARDGSKLGPASPYPRLLPSLVLRGRDQAVAFLLEQGADPRAGLACIDLDEWVDEWPALLLAASRGQSECARLLLASGAAVNDGAPRSGVTALHVAVTCGQLEVARVLLGAGASVNAKSKSGATPLHHAASLGSRPLVELLLASGADRSVRDQSFHATPAGWAEHRGHADLAGLLATGTAS